MHEVHVGAHRRRRGRAHRRLGGLEPSTRHAHPVVSAVDVVEAVRAGLGALRAGHDVAAPVDELDVGVGGAAGALGVELAPELRVARLLRLEGVVSSPSSSPSSGSVEAGDERAGCRSERREALLLFVCFAALRRRRGTSRGRKRGEQADDGAERLERSLCRLWRRRRRRRRNGRASSFAPQQQQRRLERRRQGLQNSDREPRVPGDDGRGLLVGEQGQQRLRQGDRGGRGRFCCCRRPCRRLGRRRGSRGGSGRSSSSSSSRGDAPRRLRGSGREGPLKLLRRREPEPAAEQGPRVLRGARREDRRGEEEEGFVAAAAAFPFLTSSSDGRCRRGDERLHVPCAAGAQRGRELACRLGSELFWGGGSEERDEKGRSC